MKSRLSSLLLVVVALAIGMGWIVDRWKLQSEIEVAVTRYSQETKEIKRQIRYLTLEENATMLSTSISFDSYCEVFSYLLIDEIVRIAGESTDLEDKSMLAEREEVAANLLFQVGLRSDDPSKLLESLSSYRTNNGANADIPSSPKFWNNVTKAQEALHSKWGNVAPTWGVFSKN